ncbi:hypothetical protein ABIA32_003559 [Streptacidiphilus sp. MAP12-20]|uniref:DUF4328 domain-containing protein n=1 Tax=Streptacidiphilus sp. MAP12-20 TaxID=3156299 RepID=UPI003512287F
MTQPLTASPADSSATPAVRRVPFRSPRVPALVAQCSIGLYALTGPFASIPLARREVMGPLGSASNLLQLVAGVSFLVWFSRCRHNAEILAPGTVAHEPGWAIGAWFVPVLSWWRPRRIALGILRASGDAAADRLVDVWWVLWVAMQVGSPVIYWGHQHSVPLAAANSVLIALAATFAVLVIRRLTAAQLSAPQPD